MKVLSMQLNSITIMDLVDFGGSGKSTIASLILNSHTVTEGEISINSIDVENISSVNTNSYIFNGAILDNLLIGNRHASKKKIEG